MSHHYTPAELLLAELATASIAGELAHALAALPGWVGGCLGGIVAGIVLRLLDAPLRARSERLEQHLSGRHRVPPARPSDPPDDPDPTG